MSSFNQGVPGPATLINSSNCIVYGNTTSGTALTVQQLGAGAVMNVATSTGSSALFVNAAGNVGIGTTNPTKLLQVWGGMIIGASSDNRATTVTLNAPGVTTTFSQNTDIGDGARIMCLQCPDLSSTTANLVSFSLQVAPSGTYGTQRTSIDLKGFRVANQSYGGFCLTSPFDTGGSYDLFYADRTKAYFQQNVGIGVTSPSAQLHLNGSGQATQTAFSTTGNLGGSVILQDSGASAYNGGAVVFGASQGYFAAIKGLLTNGTTNTVGDISFATRNAVTDSTLTNRLYIQSGGNVGIGTASPAGPLQVSNAAGTTIFTVGATNIVSNTQIATGGNGTLIQGNLPLAKDPAALYDPSYDDSAQFSVQSFTGIGTFNQGALRIGVSSNTSVNAQGYSYLQTVNKFIGNPPLSLNPRGGNVGIGTNNPGYTLQVNGTMAATYASAVNGSYVFGVSTDYRAMMTLNHATGTNLWAANQDVGDSDRTLSIQTSDNGSASGQQVTMSLQLSTQGTRCGLDFKVARDGASSQNPLYTITQFTGTVRDLYYLSSTKAYFPVQSVGIGTTNPSYALDVYTSSTATSWTGYMWYNNSTGNPATSGADFLAVNANGSYRTTSGGFLKVSDIRIKKNVQPISNVFESVLALKPCTFQYIDEAKLGSRVIQGFIAQEVEQVLPGVVNKTGTGYVPDVYMRAMASGQTVTLPETPRNVNLVGSKIQVFYQDSSNVETVFEANVSSYVNNTITFDQVVPASDVFVYGTFTEQMYSVSNESMVPTLVAAIKELSQENTALKTQMASLEQRLAALESKLAA